MKRSFLLKSAGCMLVAMGALTPLTSVADEMGKMDSAKTERSAMGPTGSSRMKDTTASRHMYSEAPTQYGGSLWVESEKMGRGAQGPIRNDSMDNSNYGNFYSERPTEYGK